MATCSESDFILHFPFLFKRAFNRYIEQCLPWWGQDFRWPVDPMLIPLETLSSTHLETLLRPTPLNSSRLTHEVNLYPGLWENCRKFWLSLAISLQLRQVYWRKCQFGRNGKNSLYIYFPYERSPWWCYWFLKADCLDWLRQKSLWEPINSIDSLAHDQTSGTGISGGETGRSTVITVPRRFWCPARLGLHWKYQLITRP